MDKFVTFMGYLQNFVMTSRRNESREHACSSSDQRNIAKNKAYLPQEKSHPRAGHNIRKGSSGGGLNSRAGGSKGGEMEEADGSSERDGIFLRSEVEEARTPRPKCKMFVDNQQPLKIDNVKTDSCRSQAVFPPVDAVSNSCSNAARHFDSIGVMAAQRQMSATSPEKLSQSVKKQTSLPSYSAARGLPHDQMTQQSTREDNRGNKDLQRRHGLPDIHSTEGKPLVQLRQPSIPNVPIQSKATTPVLVVDTLSFENAEGDWIFPPKDQKSRLKLPKLKKKKKKKKRKDFGSSHSGGQSEQGRVAGEKESKNPVEKGGKLCPGESKCEEVEKLSEEKSIEGGGERNVINGREQQRQQRPRTALGRWLKKRSNSVAPAPFDDVISDARDVGSTKAETDTGTPENEDDPGKESRTLKGVKMAEELATEDAACYVQTSQSGVKSRLEKFSLAVPSDDADRDCIGLDKKNEHSDDSVRGAGGSSSFSEAGRGERHGGQRKQLITLEMKSGTFEAPTVSKKHSRSEPGKTIFVKERVERVSAPFAEETKHKEEASLSTETRYDPPRMARPQTNEQPFHKVSSHKKKVAFNLEQGATGGLPHDIERPMSSFFRHDRPARRPSTFLQQFQELTNNDFSSSAGTNEPPPPLPDCKPKWHGAAPCLPAIKPEKKQYEKKMEKDLKDDFEGWGETEPAEVKRILERPISAKLPHYPAHWDPLPNERPPGRGGQGYCLGVIWKKLERSALSDSSCDDISDITAEDEETYVCANTAERAETPRKSLFVDLPYPEHNQSKVEEPDTWCSRLRLNKSFYHNPPVRQVTEDKVDIQDVE